jgi:hypothetical protein
VQTDQSKDLGGKADLMTELREKMHYNYNAKVIELLQERDMKRKEKQDAKKKYKFRRGKKSFYQNAIDEEDEQESEKSDK